MKLECDIGAIKQKKSFWAHISRDRSFPTAPETSSKSVWPLAISARYILEANDRMVWHKRRPLPSYIILSLGFAKRKRLKIQIKTNLKSRFGKVGKRIVEFHAVLLQAKNCLLVPVPLKVGFKFNESTSYQRHSAWVSILRFQ